MKRVLMAFMLVCCVAFSGCSKDEKGKISAGGMAKEGSAAPDFILKDAAGKDLSLTSLKGKVVFLNFWATWCPPCKEESPSMVRLNQIMAGKPFKMLAVSIDEGGKGAVEAYFARTGLTLPTLYDPDQRVGKMYGITGVPETFIIDGKGVIIKKVIGGMDWGAPEVVSFINGILPK
jgi:peroxiredoxin